MEMNECLDLSDPRHEELALSRLKRVLLTGTVVGRERDRYDVPLGDGDEAGDAHRESRANHHAQAAKERDFPMGSGMVQKHGRGDAIRRCGPTMYMELSIEDW